MPTYLPTNLIELARTPFKCGTSAEGTSRLGLDVAPFAFALPVTVSGYTGDIERQQVPELEQYLCELNSEQFRMMMEGGYERLKAWEDVGTGPKDRLETLVTQIQSEISERVDSWRDEWGKGDSGKKHLNIARDVYLHWGAKHICVLAKELEAGTGKHNNSVKNLADAGSLPWQCMNMAC